MELTPSPLPALTPWAVLVAGGEEAERSITKSIQLRTSLKPYVMELAANATAHGTPLMVPLWWYFPDDPELQVRTHQTNADGDGCPSENGLWLRSTTMTRRS